MLPSSRRTRSEFGHSLRKLVVGRSLAAEKSLSILAQFLDMRFERSERSLWPQRP